MRLELGIAVFARTPGSGGKSRLARTWGRNRTDCFYEHCLRCAAAWLEQHQAPATGYWALTGPGARDATCWQDIPFLEQGSGTLGERMAHIAGLLHARHGSWCLVGTDIPQMPLPTELQLPERLAGSDFLFAPAADGGFWLAAGRKLLPNWVWTSPPYSQPDTLQRLLAELERHLPEATIDVGLPTLRDIDQHADLAPLKRELKKKGAALTPAQRELLHWLEACLKNHH